MERVQADLALQVLIYAARLTDGLSDHAARFGIKRDQLDRLRAIPFGELPEFVQCLRNNTIMIQFDPASLDSAFMSHQRRSTERELRDELIRAGASYPTMSELFGLDNPTFTSLRKQFDLPESIGRPKRPEEERQMEIWKAWQASGTDNPALRLLEMHRITGVEVRVIASLIKSWEDGADAPDLGKATDREQGKHVKNP